MQNVLLLKTIFLATIVLISAQHGQDTATVGTERKINLIAVVFRFTTGWVFNKEKESAK